MRGIPTAVLSLLVLVASPAIAEEILPDGEGAARFFELLRKQSPLPGDRNAGAAGPRRIVPDLPSLSPEEEAPEAEDIDLLLGTPEKMFLGPREGRPLLLLGRRFTVYAPVPVAPANRLREDWVRVLDAIRTGETDAPEVAGAIERLEAAPELESDSRLPYLRGLLAFRAGDLAAAGEALGTAAAAGNEPAGKLLAVACLETGDARGAVRALGEIAKDSADDAVVQGLLGEALSRLRRHRQAVPHLEAALRETPGNTRVRLVLARSLLLTDEAKRCLAVLEPLLADAAPGLGTTVLAARAHLRLGHGEQAAALAERARRIAPESSRAGLLEVGLMARDGRYEAALKTVRDWAEKAPDSPAVLRVWTYAALAVGDAGEAEKAARRWIEAAPKGGLPRIGLARALLLGDRAEKALDLLTALREDQPRLAAAESLLGDACARLGRTEEARGHYEAYLDLVPKGRLADRVRGRLSELR